MLVSATDNAVDASDTLGCGGTSRIVPDAVAVPIVATAASLNSTSTVSSGSGEFVSESVTTGTVLEVSPAANVTVPEPDR